MVCINQLLTQKVEVNKLLPVLCWPHSALARDGRWLDCVLGASHAQAVETGRYRTPKVPLGERVCKNGKFETEFHFVMECNKLQNL